MLSKLVEFRAVETSRGNFNIINVCGLVQAGYGCETAEKALEMFHEEQCAKIYQERSCCFE